MESIVAAWNDMVGLAKDFYLSYQFLVIVISTSRASSMKFGKTNSFLLKHPMPTKRVSH